MPTKVTAYACSFKCGKRVTTKRAGMVSHEARCFHNPAMLACQTCIHWDFEVFDTETNSPGGHFCAEDHLVGDQWSKNRCQFWTSKDEDNRCPKCHGVATGLDHPKCRGCIDCDFHGTLAGYKQMRLAEDEAMSAMDEALNEDTEEIKF